MKLQLHDVESVTEVIDHHHTKDPPFVMRKLVITDKHGAVTEVSLYAEHTYQLLINNIKVRYNDLHT